MAPLRERASRARARRLWPAGSFVVFCALLAGCAVLGGCAAPAPMMLGGRTTPRDRVDLGVGGAARIPLGDLVPSAMPRDAEALLHLAEPGGMVPIAWSRWAIGDELDLGVLVAGSTMRAELIGEARVSPLMRLVYGVMPYGGYARGDVPSDPALPAQPAAEGFRLGALAPVALAVDAGGLFEGWLGARIGFEHVQGELGANEARREGAMTAFRGGLVLGIGLGLRRVHVLIELCADYEYWAGALDGVAIERQGIALTPGFALRLRF